ncbi:MAG: hypothetical protein WDM88_13440 [Galbitalea sp.]
MSTSACRRPPNNPTTASAVTPRRIGEALEGQRLESPGRDDARRGVENPRAQLHLRFWAFDLHEHLLRGFGLKESILGGTIDRTVQPRNRPQSHKAAPRLNPRPCRTAG